MKIKSKYYLLLAFFLPLVFPGYFASILEKPLMLYQEPKLADIIVIHGGSTTKDNGLPLLAQQRINQGLHLWRQGLAPQILVTGGPTKFNNTEAGVMSSELTKRGVPENSVLMEDKSVSTQENVVNSLKIINNSNFKSALIVTSPYHSLRTSLVWKKYWPEGKTFVTPSSKSINQSGVNPYQGLWSVVREYLALTWYLVRGWI